MALMPSTQNAAMHDDADRGLSRTPTAAQHKRQNRLVDAASLAAGQSTVRPLALRAAALVQEGRRERHMPTAEIKEQMHHLPRGWTEPLPCKARHRAVANGWHIRIVRWLFILSILTESYHHKEPTPSTSWRACGTGRHSSMDLEYVSEG